MKIRPEYTLIILQTFSIASIYNYLSNLKNTIERTDNHLLQNNKNPTILDQAPKLINPSSNNMQKYDKETNMHTPLIAATEVSPRSHPRAGAPAANKKLRRIQLWSGEGRSPIYSIPEMSERVLDTEIKTVELVIAYCRENLTWVYNEVLEEIPNQKEATIKMTIMSKCNEEANLPQFIDDHRIMDVNIMKLSNVGGCDYAYAHFINHYISTSSAGAESSLILFIKGTPRTAENFHFPGHSGYRSVSEMIEMASKGEFICGIKPDCHVSPYHDTHMLNLFKMDKYERISDTNKGITEDIKDDMNFKMANGYRNLQNFQKRALNWTFPNESLTQVCYGGSFVVPASRIMFLSNTPNEKRIFKLIEKSLTRNTTSSVEEHYTERTWAGLLENPLNKRGVALIRRMQRNTKKNVSLRYGSIWGALLGIHRLTCRSE